MQSSWLRMGLATISVMALMVSAGQAGMRVEPVTVVTASGPVTFQTEIAATEPEREAGLMFRKTMASDAAMLFDFGTPRPVAFWMKNTYLPLDMIFIAADGTISAIAKQAAPLSETIISVNDPVLAVLEVNGGTADRIGLKQGDKVKHPLFTSGR